MENTYSTAITVIIHYAQVLYQTMAFPYFLRAVMQCLKKQT